MKGLSRWLFKIPRWSEVRRTKFQVQLLHYDITFTYWYKTIFLTYSGISGQSPGIFLDREIWWTSSLGINLQNGSPFSESATKSVVVRGHFSQTIQTFGWSFPVGEGDILYSFVDFDAWNDSFFVK